MYKSIIDDIIAALEAAELERAEELAAELVSKRPSDPIAFYLLGIAEQGLSRYEAAHHAFEKAMTLDPSLGLYRYNAARALAELGEEEKAAELLKGISDNDICAIEKYRLQEHLLKRTGRQVEAESCRLFSEELARRRACEARGGLSQEERLFLLSAFEDIKEVTAESECRLLLQGTLTEHEKTDSFMTTAWGQYFSDLSRGSYRTTAAQGERPWRSRAWHYLFKNLAFLKNLYAYQKSDDATPIAILDIGCATGYLRRFLEGNAIPADPKNFYYFGVDINRESLYRAVTATEDIESGAKGTAIPSAFVIHDLQFGLPFRSLFFEVTVAFEVIKYLPIEQGKYILEEISRVMKDSGKLFISHAYREKRPGYVESLSFEDFEEMLKSTGWEIVSCHGAQAHFTTLKGVIDSTHRELFEALARYHPEEIVAAVIAPLYPAACSQRCYCCVKQ